MTLLLLTVFWFCPAVDPAVPGGATEACGQLAAHGGGGGRLQR